MNLRELTIGISYNANKNGLWRENYSDEHLMMRIVCKVAKMLESGNENIPHRLADVAIELLYVADYFKVNFERMTPCRYCRAFERFGIYDNAAALCKGLLKDKIPIEKRIQFGVFYAENWAKQLGVNLDEEISKII